VKSYEEIMEVLEAFDLTRSFRSAGELAGCSHHTVAAWVAKRDRGELPVPGEPVERPKLIDPFLAKIEEWVDRSDAKIRADVVFDRLAAVGFDGSARTVRRAVARVKANHKRGNRRVYRPWIPEPGMWAQWDWGKGPTIGGRATNLFYAWFGWSRFRVVIPTSDRTMATLIGCLDRAMRAAGPGQEPRRALPRAPRGRTQRARHRSPIRPRRGRRHRRRPLGQDREPQRRGAHERVHVPRRGRPGHDDARDPLALAVWLAGTPCSHSFPNKELALVAATMPH